MAFRTGAAAAALAILAALVSGTALAAKPLTQKQYAEKTLKTAFTKWAKTNLKGTTVKTVTCVLPKNGAVVHCTVKVSAPKYQENILFKIKETLHDSGKMTWVATSHSCTDSKTGKAFSC